ncbi:gas vesicle protein [Candidatus Methylomirabilis limnetica]|uniref:Gas vesicle protein n=1 Tax=Candidatus Methylomirabilis limnetica TaxID=2033718 RepID=A0A2T4TYS3_9BACT|nr:gas vesicle protein [Candidatus Methylomirabilis limnetica]PTL36249.1 gas vesicle protein [Candidatus Methylomirabilis limnetica]
MKDNGRPASSLERQVTLLETLDRLLNKGVVVAGDVTLSVADVDLIYVGLRLLLCSVETAREWGVKSVEE